MNGDRADLKDLIDALLQWAGQGALILDHMAQHPSHSAEGSFVDVLTGLLRSTLGRLIERHDTADLAVAAAVIADASETIGENLFLVGPDERE